WQAFGDLSPRRRSRRVNIALGGESRNRMTLRNLRHWLVAIVILLTSLLPCPLLACPFCPALVPTLCQQREAAPVVLLAEIIAGPADVTTARVHQVLKG